MPSFRKSCAVLALALAALLCAGCGGTGTAVPAPPEPQVQTQDPIAARLAGMTLREKVGQLFVVRPDSLDFAQTQLQIDDPRAAGVTEWTAPLQAAVADYPVGGFVLFQKNITDPAQIVAFNTALAAACATPPLLAIDEEGGPVARIANHPAFAVPRFESAAAVGATGDAAAARAMGEEIGRYLAEYGFNLDFAPDADVNSNPANPVIGSRAFSGDAAVAAEMVGAAVEGFHAAGMLCTLKHFPGHGDTAEDSHLGTATGCKTWAEMQACELLPFRAGLAAGADCVMAAHIVTPNAGTADLPASFSKIMLTDRLRGELGFTGVILTDSLAMEAVTDRYTGLEACRAALEAGADILLMPTELAATFDGLVAAVESGEVSETRLDESVTRILTLKQNAGLL